MSVKLIDGRRLLFGNGTIRQLRADKIYRISSNYEPIYNVTRYTFSVENGPFAVFVNGNPLREHALPPEYKPPIWGRNPDSWWNQPMNRIYLLNLGIYIMLALVLFGGFIIVLAKQMSAAKKMGTREPIPAVWDERRVVVNLRDITIDGNAEKPAHMLDEEYFLIGKIPSNRIVYGSAAQVSDLLRMRQESGLNTEETAYYPPHVMTNLTMSSIGPLYKPVEQSGVSNFVRVLGNKLAFKLDLREVYRTDMAKYLKFTWNLNSIKYSDLMSPQERTALYFWNMFTTPLISQPLNDKLPGANLFNAMNDAVVSSFSVNTESTSLKLADLDIAVNGFYELISAIYAMAAQHELQKGVSDTYSRSELDPLVSLMKENLGAINMNNDDVIYMTTYLIDILVLAVKISKDAFDNLLNAVCMIVMSCISSIPPYRALSRGVYTTRMHNRVARTRLNFNPIVTAEFIMPNDLIEDYKFIGSPTVVDRNDQPWNGRSVADVALVRYTDDVPGQAEVDEFYREYRVSQETIDKNVNMLYYLANRNGNN